MAGGGRRSPPSHGRGGKGKDRGGGSCADGGGSGTGGGGGGGRSKKERHRAEREENVRRRSRSRERRRDGSTAEGSSSGDAAAEDWVDTSARDNSDAGMGDRESAREAGADVSPRGKFWEQKGLVTALAAQFSEGQKASDCAMYYARSPVKHRRSANDYLVENAEIKSKAGGGEKKRGGAKGAGSPKAKAPNVNVEDEVEHEISSQEDDGMEQMRREKREEEEHEAKMRLLEKELRATELAVAEAERRRRENLDRKSGRDAAARAAMPPPVDQVTPETHSNAMDVGSRILDEAAGDRSGKAVESSMGINMNNFPECTPGVRNIAPSSTEQLFWGNEAVREECRHSEYGTELGTHERRNMEVDVCSSKRPEDDDGAARVSDAKGKEVVNPWHQKEFFRFPPPP